MVQPPKDPAAPPPAPPRRVVVQSPSGLVEWRSANVYRVTLRKAGVDITGATIEALSWSHAVERAKALVPGAATWVDLDPENEFAVTLKKD